MKPIIFSTPMVEAILESRKTQTRRIIDKKRNHWLSRSDTTFVGRVNVARGKSLYQFEQEKGSFTLSAGYIPRYEVGDILYVRESWQHTSNLGLRPDDENYGFVYRAGSDGWETMVEEWRWKPSIHMPKEAARIFLKVTRLRVERVLDITEEDAKAEGIDSFLPVPGDGPPVTMYRNYLNGKWVQSPISSYHSLWQSIHGPGSRDLNSFVWVYKFERVEKPS